MINSRRLSLLRYQNNRVRNKIINSTISSSSDIYKYNNNNNNDNKNKCYYSLQLNNNNVRGLICTKEIKKDQKIFSVDINNTNTNNFFLVDDFSKTSTYWEQFVNMLLAIESDENDNLNDLLLRQYVNSLPKETIGVANESLLSENRFDLVSSYLETFDEKGAKELLKYRQQVQSQLNKAISNNDDGDDNNNNNDENKKKKKNYIWALSQVFSRTFRVEYKKKATRRMMIPVVDLMNHSSNREDVNCSWRVIEDTNESEFVVEALKDIKIGDELLLSYGERTDEHFLLFYGFLPRQNPHNTSRLFKDADECLNWYQNLCEIDANDENWQVMKLKAKRKRGLLKNTKDGNNRKFGEEGVVVVGQEEEEQFILSPDAKVDETTIFFLNEPSANSEMTEAAIRVRAGEILEKFIGDDVKCEAILSRLKVEEGMEVDLLSKYRERKKEILREIL